MNKKERYAAYVSAAEERVQIVLDERFPGYKAQVTSHLFQGRDCQFLSVEGGHDGVPLSLCLTTSYEKAANMSLDDLIKGAVESMVKVVEDHFRKSDQNLIELITKDRDYGKIKDKLRLCLCNGECYRKYYGKALARPFHDMYQMIRISIDQYSIIFLPADLPLWGVSEDQVFADARVSSMNAEKESFVDLTDMLTDMIGETFVDENNEKGALWCLTNSSKTYGASVILYPGILEMVAEKLDDSFYVLPSSVHEVLVIAQNQVEATGASEPSLEAMIREINEAMVDEKELLSNKLYYYDRYTKTLAQCLEDED